MKQSTTGAPITTGRFASYPTNADLSKDDLRALIGSLRSERAELLDVLKQIDAQIPYYTDERANTTEGRIRGIARAAIKQAQHEVK